MSICEDCKGEFASAKQHNKRKIMLIERHVFMWGEGVNSTNQNRTAIVNKNVLMRAHDLRYTVLIFTDSLLRHFKMRWIHMIDNSHHILLHEQRVFWIESVG